MPNIDLGTTSMAGSGSVTTTIKEAFALTVTALAVASVTLLPTAHHPLISTATGVATVSPSAAVHHPMAASLLGSASVSATEHSHEADTVNMQATAIVFIDPAKVTLISFFKPTSVPVASLVPTTPQLRINPPVQVQHSFQVGVPNRKPPNTQGGGIPNEG